MTDTATSSRSRHDWNPEGRPVDKTRIPAEIFDAAMVAAWPGMPESMPLDQAERRIAGALNAAWPMIERLVRHRIAPVPETGLMTTFRDGLQGLINEHSRENESGTPDFILAKYLDHCLIAYADAIQARDEWYGWTAKVGGVSTLDHPTAMTNIEETAP